jgi:hypothetical protein
LPALFIPIYVAAITQPALWSLKGIVLLPALLLGHGSTLDHRRPFGSTFDEVSKSRKMNELAQTCFWVALTLFAFFGWRRLFLATKHPLLHPIFWSTVLLLLLLALSHHPVTSYRQETGFLVWLLGPAVVAMSVPIWHASVGMSLTAMCAALVFPWLLRSF